MRKSANLVYSSVLESNFFNKTEDSALGVVLTSILQRIGKARVVQYLVPLFWGKLGLLAQS